MPSSQPTTPSSRLDAALDEGRRHLRRLRDVHTELARFADPGGPLEEELQALLAERPALTAVLGMALLGWLADDMSRASDAGREQEVEVSEPGEGEAVAENDEELAPPLEEPPGESPPFLPEAATGTPEGTAALGESGALGGALALLPSLPPPPAAPAADLASLTALRVGPTWTRAPNVVPSLGGSVSGEEVLKALRAAVDEPFPGTAKAVAGCDALSVHLHHLGDCPREVLHALMSAWTAHARSVQDRVSGRSQELTQAFQRVIIISKERQPGAVFGLNRAHQTATTWEADAQRWLRLAEGLLAPAPASPERALVRLAEVVDAPDSTKEEVQRAFEDCRRAGIDAEDTRLLRIVSRKPAPFAVGKAYSTLRRAVRDMQAEARKAEGPDLAEADADIDPDWPFFATTAGKRIAVVGADIKEDRRARLQAAFQAAELEWVSGKQLRQVQSLASRVRGGTVDMVWVLTAFCSHKVSDAIVNESNPGGVPVLLVRRGYGVQNVRLAIEGRFGGATAK